jgi:hypothetical protein
MSKSRKLKKRRSRSPDCTNVNGSDDNRVDKFLTYVLGQLGRKKTQLNPLRTGGGGWTYTPSRQNSKVGIVFVNGAGEGTVRVALDYYDRSGHIAFLSAKPQWIGQCVFLLNEDRFAEGSQIFEAFLELVWKNYGVSQIFVEIASIIQRKGFEGIPLEHARTVAPLGHLERWELLEDTLFGS